MKEMQGGFFSVFFFVCLFAFWADNFGLKPANKHKPAGLPRSMHLDRGSKPLWPIESSVCLHFLYINSFLSIYGICQYVWFGICWIAWRGAVLRGVQSIFQISDCVYFCFWDYLWRWAFKPIINYYRPVWNKWQTVKQRGNSHFSIII